MMLPESRIQECGNPIVEDGFHGFSHRNCKGTVQLRNYAYHIKTIDSHTMGEPTRIVYDGFPELPGETMMDKKNCVVEGCGYLRCGLMLEPGGGGDMFGALLTAPVHGEADYGVIFLDSGGCLNMCGHGSIGTASTRP